MTQRVMDAPTQPAEMAFSPEFTSALAHAGGGAWMRELSLTLALAARAGARLDEATLIYSDVRDLMALQRTLREQAMR